jgi:hypothetical protein
VHGCCLGVNVHVWSGVEEVEVGSVWEGVQCDLVTITDAHLRRCILTVEATSTSATAIVSVHTASGAFLLQLTNLGGGSYAGERAWRPPGTNVPVELVVSSHLGGADTVTVSDPQASRCRADL